MSTIETLFQDYPDVRFEHPLAPHTSYRVGGPAGAYAEPGDRASLVRLLALAETHSLPTLMLGMGSNLLICDRGFPGLVVNLSRCSGGILQEGNRVIAGSGLALDDLIRFCTEHGLSGIENLSGIPGSVGGALKMNAGAFDATIFDRLTEVGVLDTQREFRRLPKSAIEFGYRKVPTLNGTVILECTLELTPGDKPSILAQRQAILKRRAEKQPLDYPSCGSVFKRPKGHFVGRLIESAGCKGLKLGGAQVSEKHANFILNVDRAKASDIQALIELVKTKVFETHGVALEAEVIMIGFGE